MASPRDRSQSPRRRIAGERSRARGAAAQGPSVTEQEAPGAPDETVRAPVRGLPPPEAARDTSAQETATATDTAEVPADTPETQTAGKPAEPVKAALRTLTPGRGAGRTGTGRGAPPRWALALLAGLVAVALALDGFVVWREMQQRQAEEAAARALHSAVIRAPAVAERAAKALLSYKHDTIDQDLAQAQRFTSTGYRPQYTDSIKGLVAKPASDVKATVNAEVLASGVVEAGGQRSDVLLFVNQTTTSATSSEPRTALNRVVFTMIRQDGRWVVDEVRAL